MPFLEPIACHSRISEAAFQNRCGAALELLAARDPNAVEPSILAAVNGDRLNGPAVLGAEQLLGVLQPSAQSFAELSRAIVNGDDHSRPLSGAALTRSR